MEYDSSTKEKVLLKSKKLRNVDFITGVVL